MENLTIDQIRDAKQKAQSEITSILNKLIRETKVSRIETKLYIEENFMTGKFFVVLFEIKLGI